MPNDDLSPAKQARRARILEAATHVFRAEGLRGATMERIASAAGMSKVTVYGYFSDKEAAFIAVAEHFAEKTTAAFEQVLLSDQPIVERIAQALFGKHLAMMQAVGGSPQARELIAATDQVTYAIFRTLDETLMTRVAEALRVAGYGDHAELSRLLVACSGGLLRQTKNADMLNADIRRIVTVMLKAGH
jgi:AcrR family transcriptional regulator